ncbi:MAG: CPBP family intramembrane glutamic endopeptidase [Cellulosilyticaceae bacterium]
MENIENMEVEKSQFKKRINKLAGTLIKYEVIVILLNVILISRILIQNFHKTEAEQAALVEKLNVSGVIMIVSVCFGMLVIAYYCKKQSLVNDMIGTNKMMNKSSFTKILFCFIALQPVFSIIAFFMEEGFNLFGYTLESQIASSTSISLTFSMFLYAAFLGPIVEEIIYRGAVLQTLKQYGKGFAIIISALLFGASHMNLTQGLFAFGVGLILGYVAIEYSLRWAIVIHIVNNFIFSDVLGMIGEYLGEPVGDILISFVLVIFFIGGVVVVYRHRIDIMDYIRENKCDRKLLKYTFSSLWFVILILVQLWIAISGIEKLI